MILLKFTFIHGIEIVVFVLLMTFVILYFIYWLGKKQNERDYEKDYKYLVFFIENSSVNTTTKKAIKELFEKISKYNCCNWEKLQVLKQNFYNKFKELK